MRELIKKGPYGCALGLMAEAMNCILTPNLVVMATIYSRVASYDLFRDIDPVSGLVDDRVFVFHGTEDSVVDPGLFSILKIPNYQWFTM